MTKKRKPLSWKPVRRGPVYCAPACGMGCTRAAYKAAWLTAFKLAKRLGPAWKPHVWENLGWYYGVVDVSGCWKIHPNVWRGRVHSYTAFLGDPGSPGGRWAEHGRTPELAVRRTLKVARQYGKRIASIIAKAETAVPS